MKDTINAPTRANKVGGIETDSSGNYTIYDKEGIKGILIRWDVTFDWDVPSPGMEFVDTMHGGQVLLANDSTSFDIWDVTTGTAVKIAKLWNKNATDYIAFGTDADGNETFTFMPGKLEKNNSSLSTCKFKLVYYTVAPLDTTDFTLLKNNWKITYPVPGDGGSYGPIPGEAAPILGENVRLTAEKSSVDKISSFEEHDAYTRWKVTLKNENSIPIASLNTLEMSDVVAITEKTGIAKDADASVWFDFASDGLLPSVVMTTAKNAKVTLTQNTHYTLTQNASDPAKIGILFDTAALAATLGETDCAYFKTIDIALNVFNTDFNNQNLTDNMAPRINIKNTAEFNYSVSGIELKTDPAVAEHKRKFCSVIKKALPGNTTEYKDYNNDGVKEICWQLEIGAAAFGYRKSSIYVTDTLPPELELLATGSNWKDSFRVYQKGTNNPIDLSEAVFTWDAAKNAFTLSFDKPSAGWGGRYNVMIEYYTVIKDNAFKAALNQNPSANTIAFSGMKNGATVVLDGRHLNDVTGTAGVTLNNIAVDKTGKWIASAGNKVSYTLQLNPLALKLSDDGILRLADTMGDGKDVFVYLENTFKLTNLDTGMQMAKSSSVSDSTYVLTMAEDGKSFTIDVPDETPLKLTYQVKTTQPVGTQDVKLNNSASLEGRGGSSIGIEFDVSAAYQSGSFSVNPDEAAVRILKISSEDAEKETPTGLDGAEFSVTELNADGTDKGDAVTMTTNSEGILELRRDKLSTEAVYFLIKETNAPDGYMIGEEAWKGCYAFVPTNVMVTDATLKALKEATGCTYVTVIRAGFYADELVENEPASIIIHKVDEDGNTLPGATFVLKDAAGQTIMPTDDTVAGKIKFTGLRAGAYTLEETKAPDGYKLPENASWNLTIGSDGKATVEAGSVGGLLSVSDDGFTVTVVNKSTGNLAISKTVSSTYADHATKEFTFTVTLSDTSITGTFGDITFENGVATVLLTHGDTKTASDLPAGVSYTIVETKVPGFTATKNGDTGTIVKGEIATAAFTNTYKVEPTTASFPVKKVLSVPEGMAGPKTWSYTINVKANNGAPEAKTMIGTVSNTNDTVTFGDFTYTVPGTYTYTVTETGTVAGVTNDATASKTVTVTVVEKNGVLTATADSTANKPLSFTNTYQAEPVELALQVEKKITGRDLVAGEFSFTLQEKGGNKTLTAQNAADGTVVFPAIEYTAEGEYVYTITETEGTLGGVTYDAHTVTATVIVTDNGKGALEAEATYSGETTFTNVYTASGTLELTATKTVNGAEPREDEVFSFELCDAEGKVLQTKQNAKGTITFEALGYTQADVDKNFLYTVREKQEDKSGYTLDETEYTVVVWVDDNSNGTLKVTKAITSDGKAKEDMTFANTYAADGEWTPTAVKTVNGAEPREDQVYKFALTDAEGNTIPAENAKGQISFGTLTYDLSDVGKTYTYTVQEITTSTDLLAVDESIYTVDVTVTDNKDGTLAVRPAITKNSESAQEISFANTLYAPLTISKTVEGCETAETFPFTVELYDTDGTEATGEYAYSGDVEGKLKSGDAIELAHGQSVTISGLLPGMTYTVTEAATTAFETTVNGNAGNSMEGTLVEDANEVSFVNKFKTTMFTVKKSWQGGGGGAIELTLYANGEKLDPQPAYTREENTYLYTDLPMYDAQEQPIVYSAKEKYVDGFLTIYSNVAPYADETKAIYDGGTIINKAIIKADFSVKKEWTGLAEGEIAPEITLVLYCNGVATDIKTPKPDRNGWYKYYDLPGEVDDQPAVYTVKEMAVDGYMTSYKLANGTSAEYADNGGTITNAKIPQTGDETPLALWLTLMSASAAMLMLLRKRRKA